MKSIDDIISNLWTSSFGPRANLFHTMPECHVTLWPSFPHFPLFCRQKKIQGIRLNSAMMEAAEINEDFTLQCQGSSVPLWFDVKGMQLRIREIICGSDKDHLEFILNRPIECKTPCPVWFKAGEDCAKLVEIRDGKHLIFEGGPRYEVRAGESIHIRNPELKVSGSLLLDYEVEKIDRIKKIGIDHWYLSYVYNQRHVDEFREVIGKDAMLNLKIENRAGLEFVSSYYPQSSTNLVAARGDLFVEVVRPHHILNACKLIIEKDRNAFVGSRMLLSLIHSQIPSCADLSELGWLAEIGYRRFLFCDELCLKGDLLGQAVNVFDSFRRDYGLDPHHFGF